jgi:hypothetical protein
MVLGVLRMVRSRVEESGESASAGGGDRAPMQRPEMHLSGSAAESNAGVLRGGATEWEPAEVWGRKGILNVSDEERIKLGLPGEP